ncbi:MAG: carboxypeptidase regulatory-like domain-containing protein, partial [Gemmatimonadetes bacterium]|nr:carboxypeptidase regulatory-like domain-containing protein [Gemmatimonadota bacterium]
MRPLRRTLIQGLLLPCAITLLPTQAAAQEGQLAGRVVDASNDVAIVGADVALNDGAARVSTDRDGRFSITKLEAGVYDLTVAALGYSETTVRGVQVGPSGAPVVVRLQPSAVPLSKITVSPGTFSFGGQTAAARRTMSRADIDAVPQFAEDVF